MKKDFSVAELNSFLTIISLSIKFPHCNYNDVTVMTNYTVHHDKRRLDQVSARRASFPANYISSGTVDECSPSSLPYWSIAYSILILFGPRIHRSVATHQ